MMDATLFCVPASERLVDAGPALIESARKGERCYLGDLWPALHFVMTGELPTSKEELAQLGIEWNEGSLEDVLLGGRTLRYDRTLGSARVLSAPEVEHLAATLEGFQPEEFADLYEPDALNEEGVPPGGWVEADRPRLTEVFGLVRDFYLKAARAGTGVLVVIG
jgi:hypothetical protein